MEGWLALRKQSQAFWTQSQADFTTASTLLDAGIYYASVFFSQQAAEKALKAVGISSKQRTPRGHHLIQIANSVEAPIDVMNASADLMGQYLASRNPDAGDGVPAQFYDRASAQKYLRSAEIVVKWARSSF
jgi:HEPN domain-containing protein